MRQFNYTQRILSEISTSSLESNLLFLDIIILAFLEEGSAISPETCQVLHLQ